MVRKKIEEKIINRLSNFILIGVIGLLIMVSCCSCQPSLVERFNDWVGLPDDNFIEEVGEFAIEKETGLDVDLTPRSPE